MELHRIETDGITKYVLAQLVEMDKLKQENQHLKKVLASKRQ